MRQDSSDSLPGAAQDEKISPERIVLRRSVVTGTVANQAASQR